MKYFPLFERTESDAVNGKAKRLLLICAAVLALCSLICSCTTAYGEIVYKIQYTPANGGTASESELKNVFAEYFTDTTSLGIFEVLDYSDWNEATTFAPRIFRLDDELTKEGQYLMKESFEGRHLHENPKVEMSFCFFPSENTLFLRYSWNSRRGVDGKKISDEAILDLNEQVKNVMRSRGYRIESFISYNRENMKVEGFEEPEYTVAEYTLYPNGGAVPSELELKTVLESEFFFPIAIKVRNEEMWIDDFCMYDIFRRCVILYNKRRCVIRLVNTYRDNESNAALLVSALSRRNYVLRKKEIDPRSVNGWNRLEKQRGSVRIQAYRFLYFSPLKRWGWGEKNILEYVESFDE